MSARVLNIQYLRESVPIMKVSLWIDLTLDDKLSDLSADADAGEVVFFSATAGDTILF